MTLERRPDALTPEAAAQAPESPGLTVVIPTFNERENVAVLVDRLETVLAGIAWEAVFVDDDSPDGTAAAVKALATSDSRIHCLRRVGRRGLAGAVLDGMMMSAAPHLAVMDADLQHDERLLPRMLALLDAGQADLVVASRYLEAGAEPEGLSPSRRLGSRVAVAIARRVLRADISDPVSGFFMIRREAVDRVAQRLSDQGFKILFDIIASQPAPLRIVELPFDFGRRRAGASKLDSRIVIDYLGLVFSKLSGGLLPPRALFFALVGTCGLVVHLISLRIGLALGLAFISAQGAAAVVAMTSNYLVNNAITYRDRRLHGWKLITGYLKFCGLCGLGLVANVAVAGLVHQFEPIWWLAGAAGALFGAAWNYVTTFLAVW
ncbi:MAG TPA: glycosyltransferase family 2 protein [Caulobacteraceae bacterium]|nr:glycosyltransferase family 2 protein [Caulobacteraceae bacterium]